MKWYGAKVEGSVERKVRVAILDDHPPIVEGYTSRLRSSSLIEVVATASRGEELEPMLTTTKVDVLLLDVIVPISDTNHSPYPILNVIPRLLQTNPDLAILVISMHNQQTLIRAVVEAGASGYILKDDQHFLQDLPTIVESVAHGGVYFSQQAHQQLFRRSGRAPQLTTRQLEALSLCAAYPAMTTGELAERLQVANSTMRNLLSGAYLMLEVHSRTAAVARAQQLGLISPAAMPVDLEELGRS
jgi:DNA-binding NarL/FixJ family response regulator